MMNDALNTFLLKIIMESEKTQLTRTLKHPHHHHHPPPPTTTTPPHTPTTTTTTTTTTTPPPPPPPSLLLFSLTWINLRSVMLEVGSLVLDSWDTSIYYSFLSVFSDGLVLVDLCCGHIHSIQFKKKFVSIF